MQPDHFHTLYEEVLIDIVDVVLVLAEDHHWWRGLFQAVQQIGQLFLLFHVEHLLDDVEIDLTAAADIDD